MIHLIVFLALLAFDQATKIVMDGGNVHKEVIKGLLSFENVHNEGAAFSFLADKDWAQAFFLALTSVALVVFFVIYLLADRKKRTLRFSLVLIMCGAAGNFIDRIVFSYVRDFISVHFFPPVFNIADAVLCVGAALFVVHYLFLDGDALFARKKEGDKCARANVSVSDEGACAQTSETGGRTAEPSDVSAYERLSPSAAETEERCAFSQPSEEGGENPPEAEDGTHARPSAKGAKEEE